MDGYEGDEGADLDAYEEVESLQADEGSAQNLNT
jgi:hypothetical protein